MRKQLSKGQSKRNFRAAAGVHPKNFATVMRGGLRN